MHFTGILVGTACLTLIACSSGGGGNNEEFKNSRFPSQLDSRVVSIRTDLDKDGSIDQVERFNYDDMGRLINKTTEYTNGASDQLVDYVYFDNDLIEIKSGSFTTKYVYENNRVVMRLVTDASDGRYNDETDYVYNDNGRLVGTLGDVDFYDEFECSLITGSGPDAELEPVPEIGLTLSYADNRLASITSDDDIYSATLSYNTAGQFTQLSESYNCLDDIETITLVYDNAGRLTLSTDNDGVYITEDEYLYDDVGRVMSYVSTEYVGFNIVDERVTQTYTYNNQDLISSVESTTEDFNPGFFVSPSYISTFEYENKSCVVAITANPLGIALLDNIGAKYNVNDPLLCNYILE